MKLLNRPIQCNYYVTLRCNSRCEYCDIWKNPDYKYLKEQSLEEIKTNLDQLKELGVKIIDFTGGEPLLYKNIVPALEYAKKLGFYTMMTTNGLLYKKFAYKLKNQIDYLQFSLDSLDKDLNDKRRGVNTYSKTIESIKLAKKLNQRPYIIYTINEQNFDGLDKMLEFCSKEKVGLSINPIFSYFENAPFRNKEAIKKLMKLVFKPYVNLSLGHLAFIKDGGNKINKPICKALITTIVISPDNYLLIPCFHHYFKKIKIENNLKKLYQSEELKKLKAKVGTWNFCNNCTIYCYFGTSLWIKIFSKYFFLNCISAVRYFLDKRKL